MYSHDGDDDDDKKKEETSEDTRILEAGEYHTSSEDLPIPGEDESVQNRDQ